jgi:hypothetical protein
MPLSLSAQLILLVHWPLLYLQYCPRLAHVAEVQFAPQSAHVALTKFPSLQMSTEDVEDIIVPDATHSLFFTHDPVSQQMPLHSRPAAHVLSLSHDWPLVARSAQLMQAPAEVMVVQDVADFFVPLLPHWPCQSAFVPQKYDDPKVEHVVGIVLHL